MFMFVDIFLVTHSKLTHVFDSNILFYHFKYCAHSFTRWKFYGISMELAEKSLLEISTNEKATTSQPANLIFALFSLELRARACAYTHSHFILDLFEYFFSTFNTFGSFCITRDSPFSIVPKHLVNKLPNRKSNHATYFFLLIK